jgi:hypothetical protein
VFKHHARPGRKLVLITALAASLALVATGTALAELISGSLPGAGFTFTSVSDNVVNMADVGTGTGIHMKTKGPVNVKTTYSRVVPGPNLLGWHYHNGPVIVTVTVGTLTFYDAACGTWDLSAGHTYLESTGEVLNARLVPEKNAGISTVEWFTTRLYPDGTEDPVGVDAPCTP